MAEKRLEEGISTSQQHRGIAPRYRALQRSLHSLPPTQRRVLALRFLQRRSITEIAAALGCAPAHVLILQQQALQELERRARLPMPADEPGRALAGPHLGK